MQEVVRSIRNIRAEKKIQSGKKIPAIIVAGDFFNTIQTQATNIARLANLDTEKVKIIETLPEPPQDAISTVTAGIAIYLPLMGMVDTAAEKERLQKELKRATSHIERLEKLLSSPFTKKAPTQVVANEREKLASFQETAAKLHEQLEALN